LGSGQSTDGVQRKPLKRFSGEAVFQNYDDALAARDALIAKSHRAIIIQDAIDPCSAATLNLTVRIGSTTHGQEERCDR
jgi:hypothetical protein